MNRLFLQSGQQLRNGRNHARMFSASSSGSLVGRTGPVLYSLLDPIKRAGIRVIEVSRELRANGFRIGMIFAKR
jgi:hypothetical protein